MNITELVNTKAVSVGLKAHGKEEALSELVDLIVSSGNAKKCDKDCILKKLQEREVLGSTGIGKGVAIPHAKCSEVKKMVAALGISKSGIDFKSLDGELTHIFFLLIAPGETPGPHLKALAKISRLLDDKFVRDRLRTSGSTQEVMRIIKEEEQKKV
ncbi:PTS sugar transporter subunit IIA [Candidatus Omnitrophota bacterium]